MSKTDILIPLGLGSRQDNLELRYCLRSIEKYLIDVGNVIIVGEDVDWVQNVIKVPYKDNPNNWNRAWNIYRKIAHGAGEIILAPGEYGYVNNEHTITFQVYQISDNFLYMNDDHFLLTEYIAGDFPYFHRYEIDLDALSKAGNNPQYIQSRNTVDSLYGAAYDFDVHCPIVFNKRIFRNLFNGLPHKWPEHGYLIKSYYENNCTDTTYWIPCEDLKFHEPLMKETIYRVLEGRGWFSVGDKCLKSGDMKSVLQELYPVKSKYEI